MFKQLSSGLSKFFTKQRILPILMLLFLAIVLLYYTGAKKQVVDTMDSGNYLTTSEPTPSAVDAQPSAPTTTASPSPLTTGGTYALQPVANPAELLPKDGNSDWGNFNTLNNTNIATPDLLQAGYHIGLDTIGQTLRNANYQLRSDPIIPKKDVGPWNNTTIEPDYGRVPLEIGCGPK